MNKTRSCNRRKNLDSIARKAPTPFSFDGITRFGHKGNWKLEQIKPDWWRLENYATSLFLHNIKHTFHLQNPVCVFARRITTPQKMGIWSNVKTSNRIYRSCSCPKRVGFLFPWSGWRHYYNTWRATCLSLYLAPAKAPSDARAGVKRVTLCFQERKSIKSGAARAQCFRDRIFWRTIQILSRVCFAMGYRARY